MAMSFRPPKRLASCSAAFEHQGMKDKPKGLTTCYPPNDYIAVDKAYLFYIFSYNWEFHQEQCIKTVVQYYEFKI